LSNEQSKSLVWALWCNAALLAGILLWLVTSSGPVGLPSAWAQQPPQPIAGGAGLFLMPGQFSATTWGCYVMDVDRQVLLAYQYIPGDKTLRLTAARSFTHDRRLGNFNTEPPPLDVKSWADKEADNARVRPGDAPRPGPEASPIGQPQ
jgi:hypothetical protein